MKLKFNQVLQFYGTVLVPAIYLVGLYLISFNNTVQVITPIRLGSLIIGFVGLGVWVISYLSLKSAFGVLPRKQKRVNTGIYRYINHPMYVGITLAYLGMSIANQSLGGIVFTVFGLIPLFCLRARWESKLLTG